MEWPRFNIMAPSASISPLQNITTKTWYDPTFGHQSQSCFKSSQSMPSHPQIVHHLVLKLSLVSPHRPSPRPPPKDARLTAWWPLPMSRSNWREVYFMLWVSMRMITIYYNVSTAVDDIVDFCSMLWILFHMRRMITYST